MTKQAHIQLPSDGITGWNNLQVRAPSNEGCTAPEPFTAVAEPAVPSGRCDSACRPWLTAATTLAVFLAYASPAGRALIDREL